MRDQKVSGPRIEALHPLVRAEVKALVEVAESKLPKDRAIRIVEGYRSIAYQDKLYAKGRTAPGNIVTNARGGYSYHNYGIAIDFAILIDKDGNGTWDELSWDIKADHDKDGKPDWKEVVEVFATAGWEWGGLWSSIKDYPHLQKTFGKSIKELLTLYKNKKLIPSTEYVVLL